MSTVVEPHPLQALVEAGEHVFAPAPFAVRPRPHVVAGLGRDHELVAQSAKVGPQNFAEVDFRRAGRRPVVVGEVEMGDPEVERRAADRPHRIHRLVEAEIVPEAERDRRQLQPAAAAAVVEHRIVAVRRRDVGHGLSSAGRIHFARLRNVLPGLTAAAQSATVAARDSPSADGRPSGRPRERG